MHPVITQYAGTSQPTLTLGNVTLCPDLLRLSQIGEADNARGCVVRAFFWLLDRVMPVPAA